jgi:MFS family permease
MQFVWALLTLLCGTTIGGALFYLLPFDLSNLQHFAPSTSGLILLCMPLGVSIMGPLGGILTDRYGVKPFILAGATLFLVGVSALALAVGHPTSGPDLVWRLLLVGLGMGLFNGPNQTLLMSIGPRETMGAASALSGMGRNLGFVCGPLIVSIAWSFLGTTAVQMVGGMLILVSLCVMNLIFALLSIRTGSATALGDTDSDAIASSVQPVVSSVE